MSATPATPYSQYGDRLTAPEAETLILEEGDSYIGRVTSLDEFESDYSDATIPVLVLFNEETGEERKFIAFVTMARNAIIRNAVSVGDLVGLYHGGTSEKAKPGRQAAKLIRVQILERGAQGTAIDTAKALARAKAVGAVEAQQTTAALKAAPAEEDAEPEPANQLEAVRREATHKAAITVEEQPNFGTPSTPQLPASSQPDLTPEEVAAVIAARATPPAAALAGPGGTITVGKEAF